MQETAKEKMPRRWPEGKWAEACAFLLPAVLVAGLGLSNGGFGVEARHIAGIASWLFVIVILATGGGSRLLSLRPAYVGAGLILSVAALSLFSSLWSGSVERSFNEAARVLVYLGFFLSALLIAQTDKLRQRFAEGLAISIAIVAVLGLGSRLLPDLISVSDPSSGGPRLRYPLGYWNANGALFGFGVALLLWLRLNGSWKVLRQGALAFLPVLFLGLYFTYSRGGLLAAAVAVAVFLAISNDRLIHAVNLCLALLATAPAVLATQDRRALADNLGSAEAVDDGIFVLAVLVAGILALFFASWALGRFAKGRPHLVNRSLAVSRHPRMLAILATCLGIFALGAAFTLGERAWDQFSSPDLQFPERPEEHFAEFSGAGRHDFWRVALEGFEAAPILGTGAGTYEFTWRKDRNIDIPVRDAHSVFLEPLSELGIVGAALVIAMIAALLIVGVASWRREIRQAQERTAVLLAVMAAFVISAGFDWFWEMPALGAVFFLSAGVVTSSRCSQLSQFRKVEDSAYDEGRRYGFAISGVALGWIAIAMLAGPLVMKYELNRSQEAASEGRIASAIDHALTARSLQPWAASPYIQLGGLAELESAYGIALAHYDEARKREKENWQIWYLSGRAAAAAGDTESAERFMRQAQELNPRAPEFRVTE